MRKPHAKETFRVVTTYSLAILIFLTVGISAVSHDVVRLMTTPAFEKAAEVVPWIALGVLFQGVYLLTSIGLNITKRTKYYPVATGIAAAVSLSANVTLVPHYGVHGAAWANALSYAVLAAISMWFSQRLYPIAYEYGRIARLVLAAAIALFAARRLVPPLASPWIGTLVRGGLVTLAYPVVLGITGFFEPREINRLRRVVGLRSTPGPEYVATSEQAELAGEIVSATMPEQVERLDDQRAPRSRMA